MTAGISQIEGRACRRHPATTRRRYLTAKMIYKFQKIRNPYRVIPIQIILCVIARLTATCTEMIYKFQKVGNTNRTIPIKVWVGVIGIIKYKC